MSIIGDIAEAAAPALAALLYKLVSGQVKTKDDLAQGIAETAVQAGIQAEDLTRYLTDADAKRAMEAAELAQDAVYGPKP